MLTRLLFDSMDEATLRREVIIPLLRAMGYQGVHEYHGGGELGKDIVCWMPDNLGSRVNLAIVAKAKAMSGKAKADTGTAGEVQTQIRQCFGSVYNDPLDASEQDVHEVWVVSNKKISKEAIEAIKAAVASRHLMGNVRFVEGDALWKLVEKHLPLSVLPLINEIAKRAEDVDTHYRPQITVNGGQTVVSLVEKFPGASQEKPVQIDAEFGFPSEEASKNFQASFQRFVETGEPLEIPGTYIKDLKFPEVLDKFLGINQVKAQSIRLSSAMLSDIAPVKITFTAEDGETFTCNFVPLHTQQVGTKQITLINEDSASPGKFRIVIDFETQQLYFAVALKNPPCNVSELSDSLKIWSCLSKKARVDIDSLISREGRLQTLAPEENFVDAPSEAYIDIVDKLVEIQKKTKTPILFPERQLTQPEFVAIIETYDAVTAGKTENRTEPFSFEISVNKTLLEQFLIDFQSEGVGKIEMLNEIDRHFFDSTIHLGKARQTIRPVKLDNYNELLQLAQGLGAEPSPVTLRIAPEDATRVVTEYLDWLPSEAEPSG